MQLDLRQSTEQVIAEQVRSGRFASPEAVVEEAIALLARLPAGAAAGEDGGVAWDDSLDEEDIAAIAEADAEAERGDVFTAEEAREIILGPLRDAMRSKAESREQRLNPTSFLT